MKQLILPTLMFALSAPLAIAEEPENPMAQFFEFLEFFSDESALLLDDFLTDFGPMLEGLRDQVQDWTLYETPEVLENGDIIIRRKPAPEAQEKLSEGTREI